ncbi:hypothetical protein [Actinotalea sp. K2]|uniref:hypothetical protein n=1 Tax=Actinotalea sp. K2 TaxID=2939438 RepID=UPI00201823AB|nr:hypothetical protein [Actinotalea sp. K2]MCL3863042.1 hypothetical protein [Actinotalea sp. K2]
MSEKQPQDEEPKASEEQPAEHEEPPSDPGEPQDGAVFNLDDIERELTGDPLVDRGMELSIDELQEAAEDPTHPDHEAAKAASRHLAESLKPMFANLYGDQFRRIGENLAAAMRPNLDGLFEGLAPKPHTFTRPTSPGALVRGADAGAPLPEIARYDPEDFEVDDTPQRTLDAIVDLSERMSEMVRVAAEHRDVAEKHRALAETEAKAQAQATKDASRRANLANWGTWLAMAGTWAAVIATFVVASRAAG